MITRVIDFCEKESFLLNFSTIDCVICETQKTVVEFQAMLPKESGGGKKDAFL